MAERYWKHGHRLRPREVVAEFEKTLYDELDLLREAANASQLRRSGESGLLYVCEVHWPYCPPRGHGDGTHPRHPGERYRRTARPQYRPESTFRTGCGDLLHPGFPAQLLPCRHAPGQYFRRHRWPLHGRRLRHHGTLNPVDQRYWGTLPGLFQTRLPACCRAACGVGMGPGRHPRG